MKKENGFWGNVADTVLFQPSKSETLPMWRDMYRLNRKTRELEHYLYQSTSVDESWLGKLKTAIRNAWHDLGDEVKALLTELLFHVLKLVLIIVFNILWFGAIFMILKTWLGG